LKEFLSNCRCQNNEQVFAAIEQFSSLVTPEKCTNWINHVIDYAIPKVIANRGDWSNT
jgi:hypothetical protein